MLYLTSAVGKHPKLDAWVHRLGWIGTPPTTPPPGCRWAADNGAFSDKWDERKWWGWLERNAAAASSCLFAAAPDVVGDAKATLVCSRPWLSRIRALGYPAAYVAQNGQEHVALPWNEFDVLFIGGAMPATTVGRAYSHEAINEGHNAEEWKHSPYVRDLVAEAKDRGKWVHCGRINSGRLYRYAEWIGCDSADGTFLTFGPDANLPRLLSWIGQPSLFTLEDVL